MAHAWPVSGHGFANLHSPRLRRPRTRYSMLAARQRAAHDGWVPRPLQRPSARHRFWDLHQAHRAASRPAQTPPPNPTAAGPDGRRVLSRGGAADHEVTPEAPLTGSGWREHSYGAFGGGHPLAPHNACLGAGLKSAREPSRTMPQAAV